MSHDPAQDTFRLRIGWPVDEQVYGVAIGLPEPLASELRGWRDKAGDPMAFAIPPHVTLLPPTRLRGSRLPEIEAHLEQVAERCAPFLIHLRGAGTFQPVSPVVFVPLATGIPCCEELADQVRAGPLARDLSFPYHPHVTVAHGVSPAALERAYDDLAGYDARFTVTEFTLFHQGPDAVWRPVRDFPLSGGQVPSGQPVPGS